MMQGNSDTMCFAPDLLAVGASEAAAVALHPQRRQEALHAAAAE